ncbi:MAG TPA: trypsin-like peptidase domain-containing protein [Methylotenera sp.]|nr:trypsin-like peptidase domain-containing protein [Methylotenera sp.]HPN01866.1 trypsin-like peptidase domain-containing protein [Methylotenera sp.]
MRKFLVLVALFCSIEPALALDQAKILKSLQAVVMIRGYNNTGGLAYGSGVVVAKDMVITNCHIFRSTKEPWIARGEDSYPIASVQADRWHDLCLVSSPNLPFIPTPIGKAADIKRSQEVLSIGHSNGVPNPLTSAGTIKATYQFDGGNVIRSSAKFLMGASGSGIFDLEGNLLGINTFKTPGRPAYFYSLPIEWLADLQKLPVETKFPITGKAFWEEDDDKKPFFMQMAIPELKKDWVKLAQVAENWLAKEPNNSDAWYELGIAQENLQLLDTAKASYQRAVALDASNTDALFRLGVMAKSAGDQVAVDEIQRAIANVNQDLAQEFIALLTCKESC